MLDPLNIFYILKEKNIKKMRRIIKNFLNVIFGTSMQPMKKQKKQFKAVKSSQMNKKEFIEKFGRYELDKFEEQEKINIKKDPNNKRIFANRKEYDE
jgi:hypothetical protein